jgi:hypothetical protein
MFAVDFPGAVVGRQLQRLVGDPQPIPCWKPVKIDLLEKFAQECPNAGQQDLQMRNIAPFLLRHRCSQFKLACQQ